MMFFDYHLPPHLIAQHPAAKRDDARLLVVHRNTGTLEHCIVRDLPQLLQPGDRLVFNDTKVLPARLIGHRVATGGKWEALYLRDAAPGLWQMLAQTRGYATEGEAFATETGLTLVLEGRTPERHWLMTPQTAEDSIAALEKYGSIPLPPYIRDGRATADDVQRYQTVFARSAGSVAAPTAGLHFTPELLESLKAAGIERSTVTLHVGLGTFAPIKADPAEHVMHAEWCEVSEAMAESIRSSQRVIAVGTTTARTLETAAASGTLRAYCGETSLAIAPPFAFHAVQGLLTNFHLPRTTLLLLVQALCGTDLLKRAYEEAIRAEYRFYSYGDAMLVL